MRTNGTQRALLKVNDANRKFTHPRPDGWKPRRDRSRHNPNSKGRYNKLKHLINTWTLRLAVFAVAAAMLTTVVSVTAVAKDKPLTKSELKNLIAHAETKADHERIAQYYDAEAVKYEAEAKDHGDLAQVYQKTGTPSAKYPGGTQTFNHCDSFAKSLEQAAENARQLAADHREMAKEAAK